MHRERQSKRNGRESENGGKPVTAHGTPFPSKRARSVARESFRARGARRGRATTVTQLQSADHKLSIYIVFAQVRSPSTYEWACRNENGCHKDIQVRVSSLHTLSRTVEAIMSCRDR